MSARWLIKLICISLSMDGWEIPILALFLLLFNPVSRTIRLEDINLWVCGGKGRNGNRITLEQKSSKEINHKCVVVRKWVKLTPGIGLEWIVATDIYQSVTHRRRIKGLLKIAAINIQIFPALLCWWVSQLLANKIQQLNVEHHDDRMANCPVCVWINI